MFSEIDMEYPDGPARLLQGQSTAVKKRVSELFTQGYMIVPGSTVLDGTQTTQSMYLPADAEQRVRERRRVIESGRR